MIPVNTGTVIVFKRWNKEGFKRNAKATGSTGYLACCIVEPVHVHGTCTYIPTCVH